MIQEGERLASAGKRSEAHEMLTRALTRARAEQDTPSEGRALAALGRNFSAQGKYEEALEHLAPALAIAESLDDPSGIARVSNSIAIAYFYQGKEEDAARMYRRAVAAYEAAGNQPGKVNALLNLALLLRDDGKQEVQQEAVEAARKFGDKSLEARALHQWADGLFNSGDFAEAMDLLERAERLYQEIGEAEGLATVYTSMGRLHRAHGLPAEAIPFYEKGLALQKQRGDKAGIIQSLNAIGVAYGWLDELDQQSAFYEEALKLAKETGSPRLIQFMQGSLAENLSRRGEHARAAALLEEVLRGGADTRAGYRHSILGLSYSYLGRAEEALQQTNLAVEWAMANKNENLLLGALHNRALAFLQSGKYAEALADAENALARLEGLRARLVPADFMKQGFSEINQQTYSLTILLHEKRGDAAKSLETAALARARAFLDLLAARGMSATGHAAQTAAAPGHPVSAKPHTAAQIAATAARLRSTILSYWVGDDFVMIWVVKPDGTLRVHRVDVLPYRLTRLVRQTQEPAAAGAAPDSPKAKPLLRLRGGTQAVAVPTERKAWRELYDLLIRPVRAELPARGSRLTIIPHGPLQRLSFAALLDERGRYLLEDFILHYSPAGALLDFTAAFEREAASSGGFLLVADPEQSPSRRGEEALPPLPGTRQEVQDIARLLPASGLVRMEGSAASEGRVRDAMGGKRVIHLATHAVVRDNAPLESFLALTKDGTEDGRLSAEEIYALHLRADLVVLSACRSGGGAFSGDGIAALARAFLYAGTASLIVTLWEIPDEPSHRLLPEFYRAWLAGRGKGEALRQAQLRLLRDLRAGAVKLTTPAGDFVLPEHPVFWAGFTLLGEPD